MTTEEKVESPAPKASVDKEIEAIRVVLATLEPLEPDVRQAVLEYVLKRLKLSFPFADQARPLPSPGAASSHGLEPAPALTVASVRNDTAPVHIKAFKEEKKP